MKRLFGVLMLTSIPILLMMRVIQSYRYSETMEETQKFELMQEDRLEENKRLLAGIAVFRAPERIYEVGTEALELRNADSESILQVRFPENIEVR